MTDDLGRRLKRAAERSPEGRPDLTQVEERGRRSQRRRRSSIVVAAAGLVAAGAFVASDVAVRAPNRHRSAGPSGYVEHRDEPGLFAVTYPESWQRAGTRLTDLGNPNELLVLGTHDLEEGGGCAPQASIAAAEPDDAIVFMVEFPGTQRPRPPPRPDFFEALPPAELSDCWDAEVSMLRFADSGGNFEIDVWLGDAVTDATTEEVLAILNSLEFENRAREESFFARADGLLRQRGIGFLREPTGEEPRASKAELRETVRRRLQHEEPDARLIELTLAEFVPTSERVQEISPEGVMYVVHTGPFETGDCLDFYHSETLDYEMGTCFVTDREL